MINGKDYIFSALDEFVEVSGDTVPFALKKDGETVLEGIARQFPDGRPVRFYLNRLSEGFLDCGTWNPLFIGRGFSGLTQNPDAGGLFSIEDTSANTEICSAYVIQGRGTETGVTNQPIDGRLDPRMKIFVSYAGSGATIDIGS